MTCVRCGKPHKEHVRDGARYFHLVQMDDGACHPRCCTKDELADCIEWMAEDQYRALVRRAWDDPFEPWLVRLARRLSIRRKTLIKRASSLKPLSGSSPPPAVDEPGSSGSP